MIFTLAKCLIVSLRGRLDLHPSPTLSLSFGKYPSVSLKLGLSLTLLSAL